MTDTDDDVKKRIETEAALTAATPRLLNDIRVDLERIVRNIYDLMQKLEDRQKYTRAELELMQMLIWSRIVFEAYGDCPALVLDRQVVKQRERAARQITSTLQEQFDDDPEFVVKMAESCGLDLRKISDNKNIPKA